MDFSKIDLSENQELAREIVEESVQKDFKDRHDFQKFRNKIIKKRKGHIFHNLYLIKAYKDLLNEGKIKPTPNFLKLIQKRSIRTMSGVAPVTVLAKPFACPGRCIYCPTDTRMPKSYLPSQPAAQRGFRQRFDPYTQVFARLKALHITGHEVSKVELRVLGGTWGAYRRQYQTWFLKRCLQAMNEFSQQIKKYAQRNKIRKHVVKNPYGKDDEISTLIIKSLETKPLKWEETIKENETAKVKCIGINVETRPDHINKNEVRRMRELGITKVELGVQTTDDKVQKITRRGHTLAEVRNATQLLKDAGFKISYHMMPGLPGATKAQDKRMMKDLFENSDYQPDYLKIYPCVVLARTPLEKMYQEGKYTPYDDKTLEEVLLEQMKSVPEWCRIDRLARDIPATDIAAGFRVSNIRQVLEVRLQKEGTPCRDIRMREIKDTDFKTKDVELVLREYEASGGLEMFLAYEDKKQDRIIALLRLRFPGKTFISELKDAALVREVHVYGKQLAVGAKGKDKQHMGWGAKLMRDAEKMVKKSGYKRIAVIAGIGTREYYKKRGYFLLGTYMVKEL